MTNEFNIWDGEPAGAYAREDAGHDSADRTVRVKRWMREGLKGLARLIGALLITIIGELIVFNIVQPVIDQHKHTTGPDVVQLQPPMQPLQQQPQPVDPAIPVCRAPNSLI
jgi:hypothetical protein